VVEFKAKRGKTKEESLLEFNPDSMPKTGRSRKDAFFDNPPDWSKKKID
jgi:hypothetical protein